MRTWPASKYPSFLVLMKKRRTCAKRKKEICGKNASQKLVGVS